MRRRRIGLEHGELNESCYQVSLMLELFIALMKHSNKIILDNIGQCFRDIWELHRGSHISDLSALACV